ncbi:MAG: class I SAM-dependent methyltransferase [Actinomycetota bacterium]
MTTTTTTTNPVPELDVERLQGFAQQVGGDTATAAGIAMMVLGDELGLYRAMAGAGPVTAETLADAVGCSRRLISEWLLSQAAAGYLTYGADTETFELGTEESLVLAVDDSPAFMVGAVRILRSMFLDGQRLVEAFRSDGALSWGEHHQCMFHGMEHFFGNYYRQPLVEAWIPRVDGLVDRLAAGGRVLDVGCGTGAAVIAMAEAYPQATFVGIDSHGPSVDTARRRADEHGVAERVSFEVAEAAGYQPEAPFDAVLFIEALHDMGDPDAAIRRAGANLVDGGSIVAVEINAADTRATQLGDPMARMHFAASTALCTPMALSQEGPRALGNQVGFARWTEIFAENGFSSAVEMDRTPMFLVIEAQR